MTRQDLLDILKTDGTLEEIEEAIAEKELSQQEADRIFEYFECTNKERSDEIFREILKDIDAIPTLDSHKEEKEAWRNIRKEIAVEVDKIKQKEMAHIDMLQRLKEVQGLLTTKSISNLEREEHDKAIQREHNELTVTSKQHGALSLMHAEAKTAERQAMGQEYWEKYGRPTAKFLGDRWNDLTDLTRGLTDIARDTYLKIKERADLSIEQSKNRNKALDETKDLDFHPKEDMKNQYDLKWAEYHTKRCNREKQELHQQEQKIIKEAQKVLNRDNKKAMERIERQERLDAYAKGEKYHCDPKKREPVKTCSINEAIELLNDSKKPWLKHMLKEYGDLMKSSREQEEKMLDHMNKVYNNLTARQQHVREVYQDIAKKDLEGAYGHGHKGFYDKLDQYAKDAHNANTLKASSLSDDLKRAFKDHDMEEVIDFER